MLLHDPERYGTAVEDVTVRLLEDVRWQRDAACVEVDPEIFFPERGGSSRAAREVCSHCPVTEECLAYALETRAEFGIWGNTSERERRQLRRKRCSVA